MNHYNRYLHSCHSFALLLEVIDLLILFKQVFYSKVIEQLSKHLKVLVYFSISTSNIYSVYGETSDATSTSPNTMMIL